MQFQLFAVTVCAATTALAQQVPVAIHFQAQINGKPFSCNASYPEIGTSHSNIKPKDFRFYVNHVRLVDAAGNEFPVTMQEGTDWQADDTALLDFEDGTGQCINGTPETNDSVRGTVVSGHAWRALRFSLGVPFAVNHLELTSLPSPLNLTSMNWVWNAGHKFARIEFASDGQPRGYFVHLGSTGCMPNTTKTTVPTSCAQPNRPEVEIRDFDPSKEVVIADLAALLKDTNVDINQPHTPNGCMSSTDDTDCIGIFAHLGLPFGGKPAGEQDFFRKGAEAVPASLRAGEPSQH